MQLSQIPTLVPLPFAENGTKNTIPEASQIGITPGAASLNDGFPPLTFTPLAAGGVPPSGADFNGILNLLSQNTQWQNAGGFFPYSASFSTAIGGYPKTALLAKASGLGFWLNLVDNNTTDPDTGGAGWIAFDPWAIQAGNFTTAKDTGAANAYAIALTPTPAALTPGMMIGILSVGNTNTGAATLAVNGLSALPILLGKGTVLIGGELVAGYGALLRLNYAGTAWELIWTGAGAFVAPATASGNPLALGQINDGSLSPTFGVTTITPGTSASNAAAYSQLGNLNGVQDGITTQTLPDTVYGQALQVQSGSAVTLPTNKGTAGQLIYFYAQSGGYSIVSNSTQFIYAPSLGMTDTTGPTTLDCANGESVLLLSRGDGEFDIIGGEILVSRASAFSFLNPLTVPAGTSGNQAVQLGQTSIGQQGYLAVTSPTAGGTYTLEGTFTAPGPGVVSLKGFANQLNSAGFTIKTALSSVSSGAIPSVYSGVSMFGNKSISAGEQLNWYVVVVLSNNSNPGNVNISGELLFSPN